MKLYQGCLCVIFLLLTALGCATEDKIAFEPVNRTEIGCDFIFADSRKTIMEMNEILIQTGMLFTPKEREVAIIHIDGEKQELILSKTDTVGNHTHQTFANKAYKLELSYDRKKQPSGNVNAGELYYEGYCELWHNTSHQKMKIYGLSSVPDMFTD